MRFRWSWVGLAALVIAACGCAGAGGFGGQAPRVRLVNAMSDLATVDGRVGTRIFMSNGPFPSYTPYVQVREGISTVTFRDSANGSLLSSINHDFVRSGTYTVIGAGPAGARVQMRLDDSFSPPAAGFSRIRFANASSVSGSVSIQISATEGASLRGQAPTIAELAYLASSEVLDLPAGDYTLVADPISDAPVVEGVVALPAGSSWTILLADSSTGPRFILLPMGP